VNGLVNGLVTDWRNHILRIRFRTKGIRISLFQKDRATWILHPRRACPLEERLFHKDWTKHY